MNVVVDTNIVFSVLLNTNSLIGRLLFLPHDQLDFYTCNFLKDEILLHEKKLLEQSALTKKQLEISKSKVFSQLIFRDFRRISEKSWKEAEDLVSNIDPDDVSFVALTLELKNGFLWTGDKKLREGLKKKGFHQTINTQELLTEIKNLI